MRVCSCCELVPYAHRCIVLLVVVADLHEDEMQDGCMRAWDVKEAEEVEAPAEPSPLPAADVKEAVALAPEQALKPAQRMCKFLALRLAFGNLSASDLHKAALPGSSGSSSSAERVS